MSLSKNAEYNPQRALLGKNGETRAIATASNEHDLNQAEELLHGDEGFIFSDAGYRGAEQRPELQDVFAEWFIAENPSRIKELKKHPRKNRDSLKIEYGKASIKAFVEHPFRIIKFQFGFVKAVYKGLRKRQQTGNTVCFGEHCQAGSIDPSVGLIRPKTVMEVKFDHFYVVFDELFINIDGAGRFYAIKAGIYALARVVRTFQSSLCK